ncbi:MAG: DUF4010 domain-containing protein [Bryobacteraceae bacterium]
MGQLHPAWLAMAEALLIGLLLGVEREVDQSERHAGLRDFITIALAGGLCGLLGVAWLTGTALIALTALIVVFRIQTPNRTGITTELAAVATFLLCVLTSTPGLPWGAPLGIAVAVIFTLILEMRKILRKFFLQMITEQEFHDTLRFLAVVFVILPILPDVNLGPYGFFNPHKVWIFVILICSISWLGYFLQKFLGKGQGLRIAGLLGGLASTTASTTALAKECAADSEHTEAYVQAALLSNVVQGPRILVLLMIGAPALAMFCLPALAAMTLMGVACAFLLGRGHKENKEAPAHMVLSNPLRLTSALQFGALFAAIRFFAAFGVAELGASGVYVTSAVAGSVDADSVVFSMSGLLREGKVAEWPAAMGVIISIAANFVLKAGIAWGTARGAFASRVTIGFALMTAAAVAGMFLHF